MMYYGSIAPVVVKDKLILGPSGDDLDVPAYLEARSPENGDLIWRWYVTPQKEGDPGLDTWPNLDMAKHGGGMTWQPITYDPELNHIYVTTGNPQPVVAFKNREGANLYTASIVALERRHREDGVVLPVLAARHPRLGRDADGGRVRRHDQRPAAQAASRRRRATASSSCSIAPTARPSCRPTTSRPTGCLDYDAKGQPIPNPEKRPQIAGALVTPNQGGATNWYPAELQPADRALLRQRHARVQRLVHLRRQRQSDGLGRHRPRRLCRTAAAEGDRLQDRARSAGASRATAATPAS